MIIMAEKRKGISKKIRFEIFKRDSFTCQYCGKKSPDVILNVDHISPVKAGGTNDLMNLITSCFDCNSGKKDRKLSDNTVIEKQQKQLEELNQRREQLEMMLKWRDGLMNFVDDQVDKYVDYIEANMSGYHIVESFRLKINKWVKAHNPELIYDSIDESASRYLKFEDGDATKSSVELYLSKISGILYFKSLPPLQQKINWLKLVAAKKYNSYAWTYEEVLNRYVGVLQNFGYSDEKIIKDLQNEVRGLLNRKYSGTDFIDALEKWIEDILKWDPF